MFGYLSSWWHLVVMGRDVCVPHRKFGGCGILVVVYLAMQRTARFRDAHFDQYTHLLLKIDSIILLALVRQ